MTERNRASGWRYAKISGHMNESDVEVLFQKEDYRTAFAERLGVGRIVSASVGGLCETDVSSVLGDKTKSKTDLVLTLADGRNINISIKKSAAGQVYLIGVDRFIEGFEIQFGRTVPSEIRRLLHIYFYGCPETASLLDDEGVTAGETRSLVEYQRRHNRLVWTSLYNWDEKKGCALLGWFRENVSEIADFCFAHGLAADSRDWAQYVWYINLLGEDDFDEIYSIGDIKKAVAAEADSISPGSQNGGSTTLLPFGFVQWHQQKMQFHHSLEKLSHLLAGKAL